MSSCEINFLTLEKNEHEPFFNKLKSLDEMIDSNGLWLDFL